MRHQKPQGVKRLAAELPYAKGLPRYYKWSLAARIIRVCAAATAATSAVAIAWSLISPALMIIPWAYTISELVFAAIAWRRWHRFSHLKHAAAEGGSASASAPSSATVAAALTSFNLVATALERGGPAEVEAFLSLWFHDEPITEIARGNLKELLAYAFFYAQSSSAVVAQGHEALLESMADRLEALLHPESSMNGPAKAQHPHQQRPEPAAALLTAPSESKSEAMSSLPVAAATAIEDMLSPTPAATAPPPPPPRMLSPGTNPRLHFMAHMTEPLPHFYRPWVFYAAMEALAWINHCMLVSAGYRRMSLPQLPPPPQQLQQQSQQQPQQQPQQQQHSQQSGAATRKGADIGGGGADIGGGGVTVCDPDGGSAQPGDHYYYVANMSNEAGSAYVVPIVFLHGVGMGLLPYFRLMVALAATGAPVIAFELKHISQRWTSSQPPSLQQLAGDVVSALRRHGYSQAAVLAHSFGTAVASVLLQTHPHVVRHVTMLDPICFHMYAPRLLRNFIYRRLGATFTHATAAAATTATAAAAGGWGSDATAASAETAGQEAASRLNTVTLSQALASEATLTLDPNSPTARAVYAEGVVRSKGDEIRMPESAAAETKAARVSSGAGGGLLHAAMSVLGAGAGLVLDLLMLGPARELHCTSLLCRRVVWSEVNLWEHMVPEHCTVVLSGRDDLMCARSIERWLRGHTPATVVVHPELHHAQICAAWTRQDEVLDRMLRVVYGSTGRDLMHEPQASYNSADGMVVDTALLAADEDKVSTAVVTNPSGCDKAHEELRRLWLNTDSRVGANAADVEAAADDTTEDTDCDAEILFLGQRWGAARRRGASLDSPRGYWGGGGGCGKPWRQRLTSDSCGGGGSGGEGSSSIRRRLPMWESCEVEGAAPVSPPRRITVLRHDSAGSYVCLLSGGVLVAGGAGGGTGGDE